MGWSADAYRKMLLSLLPLGRLWNRESDSVLSKVMGGLAEEMARVDGRVGDLLEEVLPSVTTELVSEWEADLDLPDACRPMSRIETLAGQRADLTRKFLQVGRQDKEYFAWLADTYMLGTAELPPARHLKAVIEEEPPSIRGSFGTAFSSAFNRLISNAGEFFVKFYDTGPFEFILLTSGMGRCGDSIARVPFVDKAHCAIQKWKPAHCRVGYRVEGAPFKDGLNQVRNPYALLVDFPRDFSGVEFDSSFAQLDGSVPANFRFWDWDTSGTPQVARASMEWSEYYSMHYSFSVGGDGTEQIELRQPNDTDVIPLYSPYPMSMEFGGYAKFPSDLLEAFDGSYSSAFHPASLSQRVELKFTDGTEQEVMPITLGPAAQDWTAHSDSMSVGQSPPAFDVAFSEAFAAEWSMIGYGKGLITGFRPRLTQKFYQGKAYLDDLFVKFTDYVVEWPPDLTDTDGGFEAGPFDWAFDLSKGGEFNRLPFDESFHQPIDYWFRFPWGDFPRDEFGIEFNIT